MLNVDDGEVVLGHLLYRVSSHVVLPKPYTFPDPIDP